MLRQRRRALASPRARWERRRNSPAAPARDEQALRNPHAKHWQTLRLRNTHQQRISHQSATNQHADPRDHITKHWGQVLVGSNNDATLASNARQLAQRTRRDATHKVASPSRCNRATSTTNARNDHMTFVNAGHVGPRQHCEMKPVVGRIIEILLGLRWPTPYPMLRL